MVFMKQCQSFFNHKPKADFLSLLYASSQEDLQNIYTHPFNIELFSGNLKQDIFGRYLRDDFYYLQRFSFGLNNLASRIIVLYPDLAKQLSYLANDIVANEQNMQLQYSEHLKDIELHIPSRVINDYANYLTEPMSEYDVLAELIKYYPCFYIYAQLGLKLEEYCSLDDNPNKEWILTYAYPDFVEATNEFAKTINQAAALASEPLRFKMKVAYHCSVRFERKFLHTVYYNDPKAKLLEPPRLMWNI